MEMNRKPESAPAPRLGTGDYFGMALGFLFALAVSYLLAHKRIFWEDEMLGWMLLTDPSWRHMIEAWRAGADGGGLAFYASCRAWFHLFGHSEVSFRLYSATCFGLAFVVNWITLRRYYSCWIVGFALFNTYFCSPPIVLHLIEGRFYGLLMLGASLCLWLAIRQTDSSRLASSGLCLAFFLANALLTTSHLLGIAYSCSILAGLIAVDLTRGRLQPVLYASVAASWLLLIPEREAIHASAQVGKPWFWTVQPSVLRLFAPLTSFSAEESLVVGVLLILSVWSVARRRQGWRRALLPAFDARRGAYLFAASLFLVPVAFLAEGFFGPSLFINRYLMPVSIATALLTAETLTLIDWPRLIPASWSPHLLRYAAAGALAATILFWIFWHLPGSILSSSDYTPQLTALLPRGEPVLLEDAFVFAEVIGRQHASGVQYLYPLDWDEAVSGLAPRVEVTQYNILQNWRKVGYFSGSIVDLKPFLQQHQSFIVIDKQFVPPLTVEPPIGNPLVVRFSRTPGYTVSRYAALDLGGLTMTAWRVTHDPRSSPYPAPHGWLTP